MISKLSRDIVHFKIYSYLVHIYLKGNKKELY